MLLNDCIKIMGSGMLLLVMPGPTNTLLLFSGYASGIRPSIKMIIAEWGILLCNHLLGSYCECLSSTWHVFTRYY